MMSGVLGWFELIKLRFIKTTRYETYLEDMSEVLILGPSSAIFRLNPLQTGNP